MVGGGGEGEISREILVGGRHCLIVVGIPT